MQKHNNSKANGISCIVTGDSLCPEKDALRIAISPDGVLFPDINQNLNADIFFWVKCQKDIVATAVQKTIPALLKQEILSNMLSEENMEGLLRKKALVTLSLTKKAGLIINGYEKVHTILKKENIALLLQASDGAGDAKQRLQFPAKNAMISDIFSRDELSVALGSCNIVHVAVRKGNLALRLRDDIMRLENFGHRETSV